MLELSERRKRGIKNVHGGFLSFRLSSRSKRVQGSLQYQQSPVAKQDQTPWDIGRLVALGVFLETNKRALTIWVGFGSLSTDRRSAQKMGLKA